jgi:hypothetical protein
LVERRHMDKLISCSACVERVLTMRSVVKIQEKITRHVE